MIMALAVPPVAFAFFLFYFLRSSKEMPKNWREFVIEMKIQASGTQGLTEDTVMRYWNKVGEYSKFIRFVTITNFIVFLSFNFRSR